MEHPHHDDSHLPDAIEMNQENFDMLMEVIMNKLSVSDIRCYAEDQFSNIYDNNPDLFQDDWKTYMVNQ